MSSQLGAVAGWFARLCWSSSCCWCARSVSTICWSATSSSHCFSWLVVQSANTVGPLLPSLSFHQMMRPPPTLSSFSGSSTFTGVPYFAISALPSAVSGASTCRGTM